MVLSGRDLQCRCYSSLPGKYEMVASIFPTPGMLCVHGCRARICPACLVESWHVWLAELLHFVHTCRSQCSIPHFAGGCVWPQSALFVRLLRPRSSST